MQSNGKPGTSEVYGAKIDKPKPVVLETIKKKRKSSPEGPKPKKRYDTNQVVYLRVKDVPFTNGLIIGTEWGANHRKILRDVWCYWIQDYNANMGSEAYLVTEDKINGRISV